ncbi:MAG: hypothetical protein BGO63_03790 [Candidatus Accumulibacter sp. 66-26]|nr:MAG: hypothetical protein BGO63_03790 [Candidatus Accumulibacter sp. 66-26]
MALKSVFVGLGVVGWVFLSLMLLPAALALGLWLLGFPLDWSSWKTYAGLEVISLAMVFLTE